MSDQGAGLRKRMPTRWAIALCGILLAGPAIAAARGHSLPQSSPLIKHLCYS